MRISVIGAGNGGQAIAGYLASFDNNIVSLYERNDIIVEKLKNKGTIELCGAINAVGKISKITSNIFDVIDGAELIMVTTTATAHASIAEKIAPYLKDGQIIILNPGRTGGALEFSNVIKNKIGNKKIYLAEAQTLVYACRIKEVGLVNIIGVKDKVYLSGLPASDTNYIIDKISQYYTCFVPCKNVLFTSFENYGAVFHPPIVLFNAAAIERGNKFYFYREITPKIADFIERLDEERITLGRSYGINMISSKEWISFAYNNIQGDSLCEKMKNNPAYYDIIAPFSIECRQLMEDIPTGAVPFVAFGKASGIKMPIFESIINICSTLLNIDFNKIGRTLSNIGLENLDRDKILKKIE